VIYTWLDDFAAWARKKLGLKPAEAVAPEPVPATDTTTEGGITV
jgi:hypothetical protein